MSRILSMTLSAIVAVVATVPTPMTFDDWRRIANALPPGPERSAIEENLAWNLGHRVFGEDALDDPESVLRDYEGKLWRAARDGNRWRLVRVATPEYRDGSRIDIRIRDN